MSCRPLDLLEETSDAHHAQAIDVGAAVAIFDVAPPSVSGAPAMSYRLRIEPSGDYVSVREVQPGRLPCACPERHISQDGSFCLYWAEVEPSAIVSTTDAAIWWMKLLTFLRRQQTATIRRQWPGKSSARAHGRDAAKQQMIAEEAASELGPKFRKLLDDFRLGIERRSYGGETRLQLLLDGRRLLSVRKNGCQLMTKRQRCKCDDADRLRLPACACNRHNVALADLTLALDQWKVDEMEFFKWHAKAGTKCCGTQDDCPLAA
jgi:hypothetical protein